MLNKFFKSLYYNFIAMDRCRELILSSLRESPKTCNMLSEDLGFDVAHPILWSMEKHGEVDFWVDETNLRDRGGYPRKFYTAK